MQFEAHNFYKTVEILYRISYTIDKNIDSLVKAGESPPLSENLKT